MDIKMNPEHWKKESLVDLAGEYEKRLINSYESRKYTTIFDDELANRLCLEVYWNSIRDIYDSQRLTNRGLFSL